MLLARVKGQVVASAKLDNLSGRRLLLAEVLTVRDDGLRSTGREIVCVDAVSAGRGEIVLVVMGSSARTAPELGEVPTDAAIVAILESLTADGRALDLGRVVEGTE